MNKINPFKVGIIGLGRSGKDIHAAQLAGMKDQYTITAVADGFIKRHVPAINEYGCRAYSTYEEMVDHESLDLVVNASPSDLHFSITLDLLNRGFNVLCEKPLAKTTDEVDQLIAASKKSGKLLAVFQQVRYMPAFSQIRKVIDSGVLGRLVQIDFTNNNFARRWDWQTLQSNNGGNLSNTGAHPLDQALVLFGSDVDPVVTCRMDRTNTLGDADDYVKLMLSGPGCPLIDIEISSCSVYPRPQFVIQGTCGGLKGNAKRLDWKYFKPAEAPKQELTLGPLVDKDGNPAYCNETLNWYEDSWDVPSSEELSTRDVMSEQFYMMLYRTLANGDSLEISPKQIRRQMAVMEECRRQNPHIYK